MNCISVSHILHYKLVICVIVWCSCWPLRVFSSRMTYLHIQSPTYVAYMVEYRYNAVNIYNAIFHTALQWSPHYLHHSSYSRKTPNISPSRASYWVPIVRIFDKTHRVITALHRMFCYMRTYLCDCYWTHWIVSICNFLIAYIGDISETWCNVIVTLKWLPLNFRTFWIRLGDVSLLALIGHNWTSVFAMEITPRK